jgi:MFS family permease
MQPLISEAGSDCINLRSFMTQSEHQNASANPTRIIVATVIGNGFVAYDFTVYGFSAAIIGRLFFPAHDAASSLLLSLATFGAGFVMRPLGAMLIGRYADRRSREAGMRCRSRRWRRAPG